MPSFLVAEISAAGFRVARVAPLIGRPIADADAAPGAAPVVVIGHDVWQRRFAGAQDVIGRSLNIDSTPAEVIGVLPPSFKFLRKKPAVLLPMPLDRADLSGFDFQALGRNVLLVVGKVAGLTVTRAAAAVVGTVVGLLTDSVPLGVAASWPVVVLCGAALVPVVSLAFQWFDVGRDTPA